MRRFVTPAAVLLLLPASALAITTYGDPSTYMGSTTLAGVNLAGVVQLSVGCSGALLSTQMHVLTAAHCLDGGVTAGSVTVSFDPSVGLSPVFGTSIAINPGWTGDLLAGGDLAILTLSIVIDPNDASGYGLYTLTGEAGPIVELAGYGYGGDGAESTGFGTRRYGPNRYDASGESFGDVADSILLGDFDNGDDANDAFAAIDPSFANTDDDIYPGNRRQAMVAPGDSGGPTFLAGLVVGIHSFRGTIEGGLFNPDVDNQLNSSYGEIFGDTRVSSHTAWIESVLVPEPGTFALLGAGLAGLVLAARRRKA